MFRSYRDTYRPPIKPKKTYKLQEYICDICSHGDLFSESDLEIHRKTNHATQLKEIWYNSRDRLCTVCMRLQDSKEDLLAHTKENHLLSSPNAQRIERIIYICEFCDNIFFNKDMLTVHIMHLHTPKTERYGKYFTCPNCSKNVRLTAIWFHLQHHDIPSPSVCQICITQFETQAELLEHIKIHKPYYKCERTGVDVPSKEQFDAHLKALKLRPFTVDQEQLNETGKNMNIFKRKRPVGPYKYNIPSVTRGLIVPNIVDICILCREICTSKEEMAMHALRDHMNLPKKIGHVCTCGEEFEFQIMLTVHVFRMKGEHKAVERPPLYPPLIAAGTEETRTNM